MCRVGVTKRAIPKYVVVISFESIYNSNIAFRWMELDPTEVNIGSGNGLGPLANIKPDLCCYMASLDHNELKVKSGDGCI